MMAEIKSSIFFQRNIHYQCFLNVTVDNDIGINQGGILCWLFFMFKWESLVADVLTI